MGGDGGPAVTVAAAAALADRADILLVGDPAPIRAELERVAAEMAIHPATEVLSAADSLTDVLRRKPDSSMRQALLKLAAGEADAVVSAGDTAALLALAHSLLEMIPGIDRPAICKELRGMAGPFWMLDLGANLDCKAFQLVQFARMGAMLARHVGRVAMPRVALLNIGTEADKGPPVLGEAAGLLETEAGLRFVGFVEGNVLFSNAADVVVADGFAGNIALKSIEGAARMAGHLVDRWQREPGAQQHRLRARLRTLQHDLDPQRYNGASFVGLTGVVVKSHGSADIQGFQSAIEEAMLEVEGNIPAHLAADFH